MTDETLFSAYETGQTVQYRKFDHYDGFGKPVYLAAVAIPGIIIYEYKRIVSATGTDVGTNTQILTDYPGIGSKDGFDLPGSTATTPIKTILKSPDLDGNYDYIEICL